ncbi:hypothetical protein BS17DRAFT_770897, partial [Gyrodon lividus]
MSRKMTSELAGTQPSISSFFSFSQKASPTKKRLHSSEGTTIDLTLDDSEIDEQPPIKKLKVRQNSVLADRWRFDDTQKCPTERVDTEDEDGKKRRHDEFKRVLLGENSTFARQKRLRDQGAQSGDDEPPEEQAERLDSDESDVAFKELTEMFSHKRRKARSKARITSLTKGKRRAEEEIGPSGQPYTPAELQA